MFRGRRLSITGIIAAIGAFGVGAGTLALLRPPVELEVPTPIVIVQAPAPIAVPAPIVHVAVAPPAPPAPPVAVAVPAAPRPIARARCADHVATFGTPLDPAAAITGDLRGVAVADDGGCTIAAWTTHELRDSRDGGQTWRTTTLDASDAAFDDVAVGDNRVVVVADARVGVVTDDAIAWQPLGRLAPAANGPGDRVHVGGAWIVVESDTLVGASDDGGATWRYLVPVAATPTSSASWIREVHADGTMLARYQSWPEDIGMSGPPSYTLHDLATTVDDGAWHADRRPSTAWSYTFETDQFWGCGGTDKLVATRRDDQATLVGGLRGDTAPFDVAFGPAGAFAIHHDTLWQLRGPSEREVAPVADARVKLVAVDRYGTAIARVGSSVLRWSAAGGWRVLVSL
nr:hypothetical protein [Kofleriaceae bacterium]